MRWKELRRLGDPDILRDRPERGTECLDRIFGLEHVEDTEPTRAFARCVEQEPFERQIRRRLDPGLPTRQSANDLLVPFSGESWGLVERKYHVVSLPNLGRAYASA